MNDTLKIAFQFYIDNQDELVKQYDGKFVVIKDSEVFGAYDDELEAVFNASNEFEVGSFLVQFVSTGDSAYSQTYYSRVSFS